MPDQLDILIVLILWLSCCIEFSTSKLVRETLVVTWEQGSPNGQERWMVKVNGLFPSPSLEFDEDDDVEITVLNKMSWNTTVHWHGLSMPGTPWSDGVPGLSQMPIEPGETFIYRFKATPPGQYWYHSHSRGTLQDGLYGSLLIRPKPNAMKPWALISNMTDDISAMEKASKNPQTIIVSEWTHVTSSEYMKIQKDAHLQVFCVDSFLINGKGSLHCPGQQWMTAHQTPFMNETWQYPIAISDKGCYPFIVKDQGPPDWLAKANYSALPPGFVSGCHPSNGSIEIIEVDPSERWASVNFIDAATLKGPQISIDQHPMWIYEVDGQLIEPIRADVFGSWAGERYAAMIKLDQTPQDYPLRVADTGLTQLLGGYAILRYTNADDTSTVQQEQFVSYRGNATVPSLAFNGDLLNNASKLDKKQIHPFPASNPALKPAAHADIQHIFHVSRVNIAWKTSMNFPYLYPSDHNAYAPLLYNPNGIEGYDERYIIRHRNGTWVDLVIQLGEYPWWFKDLLHPMHKHGNKFFLIGNGDGVYNYSSVDEAIAAEPSSFNLENPPLRDTVAGGFRDVSWVVVRYQVVNPGAWLFHCHVETHLAAGMGMAFLDGVDVWPEIPPEYEIGRNGLLGPFETRPSNQFPLMFTQIKSLWHELFG